MESLHILESYGWVTDVKAKRSDMEAAHPWYLATAMITDEGRQALHEDED